MDTNNSNKPTIQIASEERVFVRHLKTTTIIATSFGHNVIIRLDDRGKPLDVNLSLEEAEHLRCILNEAHAEKLIGN